MSRIMPQSCPADSRATTACAAESTSCQTCSNSRGPPVYGSGTAAPASTPAHSISNATRPREPAGDRRSTSRRFCSSAHSSQSKSVKSEARNWRARCCEISTPWPRAQAMARGSGGCPACQPPVPAESISTLPASGDASMRARKAPSASGERQILPRHTTSNRVIDHAPTAVRHGPGLRACPRRAGTVPASRTPRCDSPLPARVAAPVIRAVPAALAAGR